VNDKELTLYFTRDDDDKIHEHLLECTDKLVFKKMVAAF